MPEVELSDGSRLAYQQLGEGPDLVLVHGLATNRAFWYATLAQALKHAYRVTLYDLRGHGYSSMSERGYSATAQAHDLAALLDHAAIERTRLVGHSYGGSIALELAAMQPSRVERLVLMDSKINSLQPEQRLSDAPFLSPLEIEIASRAGLDWEAEPQVGLRYLEVSARLRVEDFSPRARDAFTPFGEGRGGLRGAKHYLRLLDTTRAASEFLDRGVPAERLRQLAMPCLLLYGELSRCLPSGQALAALLPQAQLRVLPSAGHFFPVSHAALTAACVADFFDVSLATA